MEERPVWQGSRVGLDPWGLRGPRGWWRAPRGWWRGPRGWWPGPRSRAGGRYTCSDKIPNRRACTRVWARAGGAVAARAARRRWSSTRAAPGRWAGRLGRGGRPGARTPCPACAHCAACACSWTRACRRRAPPSTWRCRRARRACCCCRAASWTATSTTCCPRRSAAWPPARTTRATRATHPTSATSAPSATRRSLTRTDTFRCGCKFYIPLAAETRREQSQYSCNYFSIVILVL